MTEPLRVLILEDNAPDAELVLRELRKAGFNPEWERVDTEAAYLARLSPSLDVILSDFEMPQFNGLRALELLKSKGLDVPLIIISGTIGEDTAVEAVRQGASDYLIKDRIGRLGAAVRRAIKEVQAGAARQQLQAQFIEAQKMEVIGHLAAGVAHDFNNVLAVVMSYCDLVMSDLPPDSPLREYAKEILHASERGAGLTRQLLLFSRKQKVMPVVLDLNQTVKDLEVMLRRLVHENVELSINPGEKIGRIKADPGYVGQLLMNLVVNSRDAMTNGGKIRITTRNITLENAVADGQTVLGTRDFVLLSLSDTGIGMTDEVKSNIFKPFFTTKPPGKGTGLGLATCHTIVQQCGGSIDVQSKPGEGTTFRIYFPRMDQPVELAAGLPNTGTVPRGCETVLVVEDDPDLRQVACLVLEGQGYKVLVASNGEEALQVARDSKGLSIQLVITDVIMPVMGGRMAAESLKTILPEIKTIFTSGYSGEDVPALGVEEGDFEFLPKPYTPASLARKVREVLDRPAPSLQRAN